MMEGLWMLLLLSVIMGGASFGAGLLPLSFNLSPRKLRLVTALGTGVLVGTSLIVIIPEGVETLYKSSGESHGHDERALSIGQRSMNAWSIQEYQANWKRYPTPVTEDSTPLHEGFQSGPDDGFNAEVPSPDAMGDNGATSEAVGLGRSGDREPHAWVGVSLICGFILMYLIDTVPRTASNRSRPRSFPVSLNQFNLNLSSSTEELQDAGEDTFNTPAAFSGSKSSRPSSTTVGLVIHAAADGIALGASSTTNSNLSFVIFIALIIHKAPAAFGLTSVLLKQGLSTREARTHLIIFSLAAPVGALLTWSAIKLLGLSSETLGESASAFAVGCVLLFSGGTFLYVAMHTMQETGSQSQTNGDDHDMAGYAGAPVDDPYATHGPVLSQQQGPTLVDTLVTVGGMLLPLLTQVGHAH